MNARTLDIVIVNWNSGTYLAECVNSMSRLECDVCAIQSISVIDNASTDGSANVTTVGLPLQVVRNGANVGFGAACNMGARRGRAELILFLNPDTRLERDSIAASVAHLRDDVWVVGAQLIDDDGQVQRTCSRAATGPRMIAHALGIDRLVPSAGYVMSEWAHDTTRFVDHVIGAFYLIRRDVFERLGGFDERFFVYLEDLDLSMRVRDAGGKCLYVADATVNHVGGGTTRSIKATRLFYSVQEPAAVCKQAPRRGLRNAIVWAVSLTIEPVLRGAGAVVASIREGIRARCAVRTRSCMRWIVG